MEFVVGTAFDPITDFCGTRTSMNNFSVTFADWAGRQWIVFWWWHKNHL